MGSIVCERLLDMSQVLPRLDVRCVLAIGWRSGRPKPSASLRGLMAPADLPCRGLCFLRLPSGAMIPRSSRQTADTYYGDCYDMFFFKANACIEWRLTATVESISRIDARVSFRCGTWTFSNDFLFCVVEGVQWKVCSGRSAAFVCIIRKCDQDRR